MAASALVFACWLVIAFAPAGFAGPAMVSRSSVKLISENRGIEPGRPFRLGLLFQMDPGWHIYWVNPGDSGEPPRVVWNMPSGLEAGPIEWPVPVRIEAFTLMTYGYRGQVLLPVVMHPPATLPQGSSVKIAATVGWLVCDGECIPQQARVSIALHVGTGSPNPATHELFEQAQSRLPKALPPGWKASALSEKDDFILVLRCRSLETKAVFFPLEADQIKNAAPQQVQAYGHTLRLALRKSDQLLKLPRILSGVVEFSSKRAFVVHAPVSDASARP